MRRGRHQARLLLLPGPGLARPRRLAQSTGTSTKAARTVGAYLERKVKPQLRELLTQYGPIGLIWFDTPYTISREHSIELRDLVHVPAARLPGLGPHWQRRGRLRQPWATTRSRPGVVRADYETPATLNDTWGYKTTDHHWKSASTLILLLIDLASKGVNYLLNVGPTARGGDSGAQRRAAAATVSAAGWPSTARRSTATAGSPFPYEHDGLRMTCKPGRLFDAVCCRPPDGSAGRARTSCARRDRCRGAGAGRAGGGRAGPYRWQARSTG